MKSRSIPDMYVPVVLANRGVQRQKDDDNDIPRSTFTQSGPGVPHNRNDAMGRVNTPRRVTTPTTTKPTFDTSAPVVTQPKKSVLGKMRNFVRRVFTRAG